MFISLYLFNVERQKLLHFDWNFQHDLSQMEKTEIVDVVNVI